MKQFISNHNTERNENFTDITSRGGGGKNNSTGDGRIEKAEELPRRQNLDSAQMRLTIVRISSIKVPGHQ
jgi:hypothetical protein